MHDIRLIRENPAAFDAMLARRGLSPMSAEVLAIDEARRGRITAAEAAQAERNAASKLVGQAKAKGDEAEFERLRALMAAQKDEIARLEAEAAGEDKRLTDLLLTIPNAPLASVPEGRSEHDNVELRRWGTPRRFDFAPKQHYELGEALGLMDFETASKISGARFVILKGALARLERAIAEFMLDIHTAPASGQFGGYTECQVPLLVKDHAAYGTGNLPKFEADLFAAKVEMRPNDDEFDVGPSGQSGRIEVAFRGKRKHELEQGFRGKVFLDHPTLNDGRVTGITPIIESTFRLIPTAEVSLTNFVREQILSEDQLPMRLTAWTPCFRSEAGSAGKDTRGMIRQHQFTKVELVSITTPEQSVAEHERMTGCAEEVLKRLGLPYRTILLCTGDMGFASQKTHDLEVWLPGQDTYREISSCSVCGDFQARRMNARFRRAGEKRPEFLHTLNGSGLAVGRTLIAVMENGQEADGGIVLPEALRGYMGGAARINPDGSLG